MRRAAEVFVGMLSVLLLITSASADGNVSPADSSFVAEITRQGPSSSDPEEPGGSNSDGGSLGSNNAASTCASNQPACTPVPDCGLAAGAQLVGGVTPDGLSIGGCMPGTSAPPAVPGRVTQGLVLRALRRVGLPRPVLVVQPVGGRTLVGLESIFVTRAPRLRRSVVVVGRRVELDIVARLFTWRHGDGSVQVSRGPGVGFRAGRDWSRYVSHRYARVGVVQPRVAVSYGARFRVEGGRWRAVEGVVSVVGEPVRLEVVEAEPVLVAPSH